MKASCYLLRSKKWSFVLSSQAGIWGPRTHTQRKNLFTGATNKASLVIRLRRQVESQHEAGKCIGILIVLGRLVGGYCKCYDFGKGSIRRRARLTKTEISLQSAQFIIRMICSVLLLPAKWWNEFSLEWDNKNQFLQPNTKSMIQFLKNHRLTEGKLSKEQVDNRNRPIGDPDIIHILK